MEFPHQLRIVQKAVTASGGGGDWGGGQKLLKIV